ncbi:putative oxidoreductase [Nocardia brasiliensis NBRC 14402]|uniref:D-2-hydroxyacid dehydrogenase n=1 Tax=Nocardia brasiliensis TaxID=37326 RepID=UPI00045CDF5D|nr:D-2-hydroxyacid dehydrogenase [Nocardia brasiliensis]ASF06125.1 D-2-hydroxyacid dehydrogenase [Nocardia brasiliensis]GAJ83597.1 putative oxidoreductase [Nocardia brasiliensis NBRC 14402]SUB53759.1 Glycerate dehydrogenase [Nocardia brasiliensis]
METGPIVTVLHSDRVPEADLMAAVSARATVRYTEAAGLATALRGADVLFVYDFLTRALPGAWPAADRLRWLHMGSTGVDPAMFPELRASDVVVTNTRGLFDTAIAEYVLGQILGFAKDLPGALRRQLRHDWAHRENERIAGATVLIVGTGSIGRAIARLLRAAGMNIRAVGRRMRPDDPDFGAVSTDLHAELPAADYVVAIAPLTPQTRNMFGSREFAAMKPHARFVNVGRGELVVTDDLVAALGAGSIAGAALDVVAPEPLPPDHPLWDLPNVSITPHNSGDFIGWRTEIVSVFAENFDNWIAGRPLRNVVDKELGYVPG